VNCVYTVVLLSLQKKKKKKTTNMFRWFKLMFKGNDMHNYDNKTIFKKKMNVWKNYCRVCKRELGQHRTIFVEA